jgi:hypothetical protein
MLCWQLSLIQWFFNSFTNILLWMFRQTFVTVLLTAVICFLCMTNLFGLFVWITGQRNPDCIGGFDAGYENYVDAFQLSWTTFTTVVCRRTRERCIELFLSLYIRGLTL